MLVIVDEVENIFRSEFTLGKDIIDDLYAIGDLDGGAIHCILSGSSRDLRPLAFGKLSSEKHVLYQNYTGRNLNPQKFAPVWIYPFCNRDDFIRAVQHMKQRFPSALENVTDEQGDEVDVEEDLNGIFIKSGGIMSFIEKFARNGLGT